MKTTAIALALVLTLLFLGLAELQFVKSVGANAYVFGMMPRTYIHSPENKTYATDSVPAEVTFEISQRVYDKSSNPTVTVQLDNAGYKMNGWFTIPAEYVSENDTWVIFHGETTLSNLSDGLHEVRFSCSASSLGSIYDTVACFTVEAHAPVVTVLSPENKTYGTNAFPLNVTVNEDVLQIRYSLDGKENVTVAGYTTLSDLPNGSHHVRVYAIDNVGKIGASEAIAFAIDIPESTSQSEPFPAESVAAVSGTSAAVIVAAVLIYLKKHKTR